MPVVWIPALLRPLAGGQETVTVPGATVQEVVAELEQRFPGIRARICDEHGLRPGMAVVVDAEVARLGLLQPVGEKSEVHFLPAIGGGMSTVCPRQLSRHPL